MKKYIIKSKERGTWFIAIRSYTPFFGPRERAMQFVSVNDAEAYAMKELFTVRTAFVIESALPVTLTGSAPSSRTRSGNN